MKRSNSWLRAILGLLIFFFLPADALLLAAPADTFPGAVQRVVQNTQDADARVTLLIHAGNHYYSQYTPDGYGKAATYYQQALDLAIRYGLKQKHISICKLLGAVNDALGDEHLPAALQYYQEFMYQAATELHDTLKVISACIDNASVLRRMHRYPEARDALQAAVVLVNRMQPANEERRNKVYITAAFYSGCMNDTTACKKYYALTDSSFYPFYNDLLPFHKYFRLTNFYLAAFDNRPEDAMRIGNDALAEAGNPADSMEVCSLLADYLRTAGNTAAALHYREIEYRLYKQSLKVQTLNDANNKLLQSELFLKEENSRLLQQQQRLQQQLNTWLKAGLMLLAALLAYMFVLAFRSRKQNRQLARRNREKAMLLREIHHRVKNNLEMLHSMLSLQMKNYRGNTEVQHALGEAGSRIQSIALLHEQLYNANLRFADAHNYFEKMFARILDDINHTRPTPVTWQLNIMTVQLPPDTLLPLALLVNECLTNSIKHAFASGQHDPAVSLSVQLVAPGELQVIYADNGAQYDAPANPAKGFGTRLVYSLARQLKGTLFVAHGNTGWQYTLTLPFSDGDQQY